MKAVIQAVSTYVPEGVLNNEELARDFPEYSAEKIFEKTGIRERRVVEPGTCASDLAEKAALELFKSGACRPEDVAYLILCTQTPDFFLPASACLLQERLGITRSAGAIDVNQGCSGYVYGLGLAKGLVETGQASTVLLLTADTYSRLIHPKDRSVRTLFGDAAAATLVRGDARGSGSLGPFVYGTDGRGASNLMVRAGGFREAKQDLAAESEHPGPAHLYMNGPEIFTFSLDVVPRLVKETLVRGGLAMQDVDLFVFHQANRFMLDHLRAKLHIPSERFLVAMEETGNTGSSSIPLALAEAGRLGRLEPGMRLMLVGFGVGYSWAAGIVVWAEPSGMSTAE